MKNDHLLQDLRDGKCPEEKIEFLRLVKVNTYSRLLELIGDEAAEPGLRKELCVILWCVARAVDKRVAAGPVLTALGSDEPGLRQAATMAANMMQLKRVMPKLIELATDKRQPYPVRMNAIQALGSMEDARALSVLRAIVADGADSPGLRGDALEQTVSLFDQESVRCYVKLLGSDVPELRFWAAYCLGFFCHWHDISPALDALDRIVASDHVLPTTWGWHIDREALLAYEAIHYQKFLGGVEREADVAYDTYIISPAAEYDDFINQYRHWAENWEYATDAQPAVSLRVKKKWLADRFKKRWPEVTIGARRPAPRGYLFDFRMDMDSGMVIGGLHRDRYALVLTGLRRPVCEVAAWYRGLFPANMALYLYPWATPGMALTGELSPEDIEERITHHP